MFVVFNHPSKYAILSIHGKLVLPKYVLDMILDVLFILPIYFHSLCTLRGVLLRIFFNCQCKTSNVRASTTVSTHQKPKLTILTHSFPKLSFPFQNKLSTQCEICWKRKHFEINQRKSICMQSFTFHVRELLVFRAQILTACNLTAHHSVRTQ